MATPSKRSVSLAVEAQVTGEADIRRLATTVRSLAESGDAAAADYSRLAAELDKFVHCNPGYVRHGKGILAARADMARFEQCIMADEWPGFPDGILELDVPPWAD